MKPTQKHNAIATGNLTVFSLIPCPMVFFVHVSWLWKMKVQNLINDISDSCMNWWRVERPVVPYYIVLKMMERSLCDLSRIIKIFDTSTQSRVHTSHVHLKREFRGDSCTIIDTEWTSAAVGVTWDCEIVKWCVSDIRRSRYIITIGKFHIQKVMRVQARRNVYQMVEYYGSLNCLCAYMFISYVLETLLLIINH